MIGIFISVWVFLVSWALPGQGLVEALSLAGTFLFYWTAFWSLLLFGLVSFFLAVGGAVLLRLPPPFRALAAPFFLAGGFRAFFSKPVFIWIGSVALLLAGAWTLRTQAQGTNGLLGLWLIAVGDMARRFAWSALKSKAQVRVFGGDETVGDAQGVGEPEVMGASPVDSRRFESAEIVESIEVVPAERQGPQRK